MVSPTLLVITLSGLEQAIKSACKSTDKVNVIVYADDFIITGVSKEVLENKVKPAIVGFLKERGLELSPEKTIITHIEDGFDFLGFNVRKYGRKLLIKPAKKNVISFLRSIRKLIKENGAVKTDELIRKLNARIRGWANYYRHAVSKETFSYVDNCIFRAVIRWIKRRHSNKSIGWMRNKYFRRQHMRNWIFSTKTWNKEGDLINLDLFLANSVKIKRHTKIRNEANLFDPAYKEYFEKRAECSKISARDPMKEERRLPIF